MNCTAVKYVTVACCLLVGSAQADVVQIGASKDNTLYEEMPGGNDRSNGAGGHFFAGNAGSRSDGATRRALLAFDIFSSIPALSTIDSVTLTLNMSRTQPGTQDISLHRVLTDWGEGTSDASGSGFGGEGAGAPATTGDATWRHTFFNTDFWTNQGGDFEATASATQSVGGIGSYTWGSTPQMVSDVQQWLDTPASNFGWILLGNETGLSTAKRFDSRNHFSATARPQLTVTFTPIPEPGAAYLVGSLMPIAAAGVWLRRLLAAHFSAD